MTETPQHDRVLTENLRDVAGLRRSVTDRKVAGVAGGLGRHLNVDPTILRVLFVVLCFFGGAGFVLYGALWLLVPEDGHPTAPIETSGTTRAVLLAVAAGFAGLLVIGDSWGGFGFPWPLAIVALVVFLVLMNRDKPMRTTPSSPGAPGATGAAGAVPPAASGPVHGPAPEGASTYDTTAYDTTAYDAGTDALAGTPTPPAPPVPPVAQGWVPPAPPAPPRRRGPLLFGPTLALVAVALGSLGLYDAAGGDVTGTAYPALALAVVGVMLVVGAWVGRAGGLILLGLVTSFALAVTAIGNGSWTDGWDGDRRLAATPFAAADVRDHYQLPAGQVRLDLTRVQDLEALDGRTIDLEANAGELLVLLPEDVTADVDADIDGPGAITFDGSETGGVGTHRVETLGDGDAAHLTLNLDLSVGHIEVRQQ